MHIALAQAYFQKRYFQLEVLEISTFGFGHQIMRGSASGIMTYVIYELITLKGRC